MSKIDDGGAAFPNEYGNSVRERNGMSLRDYFASQAMQGICASRDEAGTLIEHGYEWIASEAYRIADAMLKERNKS